MGPLGRHRTLLGRLLVGLLRLLVALLLSVTLRLAVPLLRLAVTLLGRLTVRWLLAVPRLLLTVTGVRLLAVAGVLGRTAVAGGTLRIHEGRDGSPEPALRVRA